MKIKPLTLLVFIVLGLMQVSLVFAEGADAYRLRQGDGVLVSVWGEATLNKEVRVLPDGSITFPLAGRVEVANLTTPEIEKRIAEKLKTYFPEPQVTVVVTSTEGTKAYILGKVLKPGPILITGPMTVLQALSMAGGVDKFASLSSVKILRTKADSTQEVLAVHYDKLLQGEDLHLNVQLQAGDTIVVP